MRRESEHTGASQGQQTETFTHAVADCDRRLRADPSFDASLCEPKLWMCECGRAWAHVCDEAEGCFWGRMPGNDSSSDASSEAPRP